MPLSDAEASDNSQDFADFTEDDIKDQLAELSLRNQRKQIRHELTDPFVWL